VLQYGLTGGTNTAGNFDVAPVFNIGTGGQTVLYAQEPTPRTTSVEIPPSRTINNATINNTNGVVIAGGDLTLNGTLTFTVGNVTTNANTVIIGGTGTVSRTSGHVIGNLKKIYPAAASKTFKVGTANGFSPVTVNITSATFPTDFTVKAVQGQLPQISGANALQRYWTLSPNISGIVANLTFNYLATDVVGTAANYDFYKNNGGTLTQVAPSAPPTITQATVNGVSSFSDWTLAEGHGRQRDRLPVRGHKWHADRRRSTARCTGAGKPVESSPTQLHDQNQFDRSGLFRQRVCRRIGTSKRSSAQRLRPPTRHHIRFRQYLDLRHALDPAQVHQHHRAVGDALALSHRGHHDVPRAVGHSRFAPDHLCDLYGELGGRRHGSSLGVDA